MKLTKEVIEERMLCDFKIEMERFYAEAEKEYFLELNRKIKSGEIDKELENTNETEKSLALKEARNFFKEMPQKRLVFVKKYCEEANNIIFDSIKNNKLSKTTGKTMFKMLKHFILAAEIEVNPKTKMSFDKKSKG